MRGIDLSARWRLMTRPMLPHLFAPFACTTSLGYLFELATWSKRIWIIRVAGDRSVLYALDRIVHDKTRNEEPFARDHRIAEPILDFDVEPTARTEYHGDDDRDG